MPSFSSGEYYDYSSLIDSNKYEYCDCLRSNPLVSQSDNCNIGLDQDKFNSNGKSKRSIEEFADIIDRPSSSSANTLENLNLNSILKEKEIVNVFLKFLAFIHYL